MKRIIQITLFVLFATVLAGLMGFIYIEQGRQPVQHVAINLIRTTDKGFLNEDAIKGLVHQFDSLSKRKVNQVHPGDIESAIAENPYVKSVDAFVDINKTLVINVQEKEAFLRIFNQKHKGFYLDDSGNIIPLSTGFTPRVMVASGYVDVPVKSGHNNIYDSLYADTPLCDLLALTKIISSNTFLNAQIGHIYVNSQGEFDLTPQLGNHLIRLGSIEDAQKKLENLELFYKKALLREGWEKYETINLKYKNQVVCKRK